MRGVDNPADCASRGLTPCDTKIEFWLNGLCILEVSSGIDRGQGANDDAERMGT